MADLRIGGLATGLDTDMLVANLMKAQRAPVNKLLQDKQILEWQRDDYRDINNKIRDFRENKLSNYRLESTFVAKKIEITGNTTAVSASPTGNAMSTTLTIEVHALATAATNISTASILSGDQFDPAKTLASQNDQLAGGLAMTGDGSYQKLSFKVNGQTISVDPNVDSMTDVVRRINDSTNVSAFYDTYTGKVSLISKDTGLVNGENKDAATISLEDVDGGNFLAGILQIDTAGGTAGTRAEVVINGLSTQRDSNKFTVNGVELTLLGKTDGVAAQLAVNSDTDKIVEAVKSFINDYNEMLKTLQDKLGEERNRSFLPLTEDQKKDMKDTDIEKWEEKAKSGLLRNDTIINSAISKMRLDIASSVSTDATKAAGIVSLASLGIESGSYLDNGKLYLTDETKLREAIEQNPEAIRDLFTASGEEGTSAANMGVGVKLYNDLKQVVSDLDQKAGFPSITNSSSLDSSLIGQQLYRLGMQIDDRNRRLVDIENRYYKQFTALEVAINRFNQQSAYLMNNFGIGASQ